MSGISIKIDTRQTVADLKDLAAKQIPFATAGALNAMAKEIRADETQNIRSTFRNPRPFTFNSVAVRAANRTNLPAIVYVRDITAKYLDPYEFGGDHVLPGHAL